MSKRYYAAYNPRGFDNEIEIHTFPTRAARDAWVHENDLDDAYRGAWKTTAKRAKAILTEQGDAATAIYHSLIEHA